MRTIQQIQREDNVPYPEAVRRLVKERKASDCFLPEGITYGGRGSGGEFYSKDIDDLTSISLWTEGEESWTADELEAIARHKKNASIKP